MTTRLVFLLVFMAFASKSSSQPLTTQLVAEVISYSRMKDIIVDSTFSLSIRSSVPTDFIMKDNFINQIGVKFVENTAGVRNKEMVIYEYSRSSTSEDVRHLRYYYKDGSFSYNVLVEIEMQNGGAGKAVDLSYRLYID